jgi:hypothetical protein
MTYALASLYVVWCGYVWTLRGGGFGAIVRKLFFVEPGTTVTRIVCALLMAAPLVVWFDPSMIVLWPSIYVAMTLGYFDESMGLEQPGRDHLFLALWGLVVASISIAPLAAFNFEVLWFAPIGALAVAAYAINKPFGRRFGTDWTERAELCTGLLMGLALVGAAWR